MLKNMRVYIFFSSVVAGSSGVLSWRGDRTEEAEEAAAPLLLWGRRRRDVGDVSGLRLELHV